MALYQSPATQFEYHSPMYTQYTRPAGRTTPGYTTPQPPRPPSGGGGGGGGGYNYATDPALQSFLAFYQRERQAAGGKRDEARRRRLIQLGSRDVARRILGEADPILASISSDPNSTSDFGRMLKQYNDMLRGIDESTSYENVFWGTGRAEGYQGAAYQRQQGEADLVKAAEADIQGYQDIYDQILRDLEMQKQQAEQQAWMNQMWSNLFSSGGGGGNPAPSGGTGGYQNTYQSLWNMFDESGRYTGGYVPSGGSPPPGGAPPTGGTGLATPIANPGTNGSNMRYDITGLAFDASTGLYTDGTYHYDQNGLSTDRPDVPVPGLNPANNN